MVLSGVVTAIGALHGRALDEHDLAGVKWKSSSADAVQRLERKMGHISMDDCAICRQSLTVTKADCLHHFHSSCLEDWLLDHSDTCPVCRAKIGFKEVDTERSGTAVGQAETAHGVIDETADGDVGSKRLVGETAQTAARYSADRAAVLFPLDLNTLRYGPAPLSGMLNFLAIPNRDDMVY